MGHPNYTSSENGPIHRNLQKFDPNRLIKNPRCVTNYNRTKTSQNLRINLGPYNLSLPSLPSISMIDFDGPSEIPQNARVWEDPDESPEVPSPEEPEWLRNRRLILKEGLKEDSGGLLRFSGRLTSVKPSKFKSGVRFKIIRQQGSKESFRIRGGVKDISFDEDSKYMSVLGIREKGLKLFFVDQNKNKFKLKSGNNLIFPDYSVTDSCFKGDSVYLIAKNKKLLKYDISRGSASGIFSVMVPRTELSFKEICASQNYNYYGISCSNTGSILVCDARDNLLLHNFKMNSECMGFGFIGDTLVSCDRDSYIYEFDLKGDKCRNKFKDPNSSHVSTLSVFDSGDASYFGTGTRTGYVNLYNLSSNRPFKTFDNLTTEVTDIHLEEDWTIFSSKNKKNSVRVAYNRNYNVIANWPNEKSNLGRVSCVSYCRRTETVSVGTKGGRIHFHRLFK